MPKFEIKYSSSVKGYLITLGMIDAFVENADFSLMKKGLQIFIQDVIHKTFIEVDEDGTEVAGCNENKGIHQKPPEDIIMKVDHPFLFIIRTDNFPQGYNILFISKIESF